MLQHNRFLLITYSDFALKVVAVAISGLKPTISYFGQETLAPGIVFDDRVTDLIRFKESVRKLLSENSDNFNSRAVVLALNEQEVFLNRFNAAGIKEDLKDGIGKFLEPRLPYSLGEATVRFRKTSGNFLQLISTRHQLIRDLVSIFENTDFELKWLEPLPLPCLNLFLNETEPYIFVLSEDQSLEFALVVSQAVVFSATLKLVKDLKSSSKEILATIKELVEVEFENHRTENSALRNIFLVGENREDLQEILAKENLKPKLVDLKERFHITDSSDASSYSKALLTALAQNQLLAFSGTDMSGVIEKKPERLGAFPSKRIFVLLATALIVVILFFAIFWFRQKPKANQSTANQQQTQNQTAKKAATSSAKKQAVLPPTPTPPVPTINKADLKVEVLNGTDTTGLAGQTKTFLVGRGYNVVATGNADNTSYQQTVVKFKLSKEQALTDLTNTLSERYSVTRGDHLAEDDQFDFIIIVGRK